MAAPALVSDLSLTKPHVFILGAGASRAALPEGDRYGRTLPLMNELVDVVGLAPLLDRHHVDHQGRNFEAMYADLRSRPELGPLCGDIERAILEYFGSLALPDYATAYDYLVLSLRAKDVIATFNWDPFLWQACARNHAYARLPNVLFLHGCVAVGYCLTHETQGLRGESCSKCAQPFQSPPLLYPVNQKNYSADPCISAEWRMLRDALGQAFVLSIFGYGAPASDVDAVDAMKAAWGPPATRELEQIEIIDIRREEELRQTWAPFILEHHYETKSQFCTSWAINYPRRSCEAVWRQFMEVEFLEGSPPPRTKDLGELRGWLRPLIAAEEDQAESRGSGARSK